MTDAASQPSPQGAADGRPGTMDRAMDGASPGATCADASHEMANLMTVVLGSLEQLRRQPLDERERGQLARAEWGARQAARLMRQALSQAEAGSGTPAAVDLNAVVGGLAGVAGGHVSKGVQVTAELAPGVMPVRLDAGLLELVLLNLIRTAADAMPDGGAVVLRTKEPRLDGLGGQLATEVSVSDDGTGTRPAVARRATDASFGTRPGGEGADLELWMAERFAAEHGGKVGVETAPGQGTTVRLALPYAGDAEPG